MHGVKKYENPGLPWPCGVHSGETPGLMLGLAGIGYFYLRLTNASKIPSVAILTPQ
jgi:lantibiotic biosynthesis protein